MIEVPRQEPNAELIAKAQRLAAAARADGRLERWPRWSQDDASRLVWQTVAQLGETLANRAGLPNPHLWGLLLAAIAKVETGEDTAGGGWQRRFLPPDGNLWGLSGEYGPKSSQADADFFDLPALAGAQDAFIRRAKSNPLRFKAYPTVWNAHANALRYLATSTHYPTAQRLMREGDVMGAVGFYAWPATGVEGRGPSGYTPDKGWSGAVRGVLSRAMGGGSLPSGTSKPAPEPPPASQPGQSVGVYRDPSVGVYVQAPNVTVSPGTV